MKMRAVTAEPKGLAQPEVAPLAGHNLMGGSSCTATLPLPSCSCLCTSPAGMMRPTFRAIAHRSPPTTAQKAGCSRRRWCPRTAVAYCWTRNARHQRVDAGVGTTGLQNLGAGLPKKSTTSSGRCFFANHTRRPASTVSGIPASQRSATQSAFFRG